MTGAGATTTGAGATTTGGGTTQNPGPHQPRCHQAKLGETETSSSPTARTATIAVFFIVLRLLRRRRHRPRRIIDIDEVWPGQVYLDPAIGFAGLPDEAVLPDQPFRATRPLPDSMSSSTNSPARGK